MTDARDFRARQLDQGELWEELKVESTWFHVVRGMIYRGAIKEMGPMAWAIYCVLKSHADLKNGVSYPGVETIAELVGVSHDTVNRALKKLADLDLIEIEKRGRSNRYMIKEKVAMITREGDLFGVAETPYVPIEYEEFVRSLKRFAESGNLPPGGQGITINVTLNIQNIQQRDGGTVSMNVQQIAPPAAEPAPLNSLASVKRRLKRLS